MKILSLFDGIACGYEALINARIKIDLYLASEIDNDAIRIAQFNHPDIIEIGDVRNVFYRRYKYEDSKNVDGVLNFASGGGIAFEDSIDLLIGGSPCTNFSSIGYAQGMKTGNVDVTSLEQYLELKRNGAQFEGQSYLFWEYVRLLCEVKPKWFLLENVEMSKKWESIVTNALGVEPIRINSSLVSAQNRPRLYWTNIKGVTIPKNRNVMLLDVLDKKTKQNEIDVINCMTIQNAIPKLVKKYGYLPSMFNAYNVKEIIDKACALSRGSMITSSCAVTLFVRNERGVHKVINGIMDEKWPTRLDDGLYNLRRLSIKEMERLQTMRDGYVDDLSLSTSKKGQMLGNGWTVEVISHIFSFLNQGD